jgi:hypothetical protein
MVMVEYFANAPPRALGDFASSLHSADAHVLARPDCTLAHIDSGIDRVKCDKVARSLPNPFGRRSCALGGPFADVPRAPAHVATGASLPGLLAWFRLLAGRRLRGINRLRLGSLRLSLSLAVLAVGIRAADENCESQERNGG